MDGDVRGARRKAAGRHGNVPRIAAGGGRTVPVSRRIRAPALVGADAEGIQAGVAGVAVRGERVVVPSGTQPGPAVRHAELTRLLERHRSAVVVLRPPYLASGWRRR